MANKKTINGEHSDITERSRSNQSVQRRPLKEVLKGRRPKSHEEIGSIVNGVLDMRRDMFDKEASFEFADRIADPHDEYGDRAIETVGGVVSYIADINSYEALSGLLEYDDKYNEEDWFRWGNKEFCKMLIRGKSYGSDIRHLLNLEHREFIGYLTAKGSKAIPHEINEGQTLGDIIQQRLDRSDRGWNLKESYVEYIDGIRNEIDHLVDEITKPLFRMCIMRDTRIIL